MKRSLWFCFCSVSLLTLAACGDDAAPGETGDGGVDGGSVPVDTRVDQLDDQVMTLGDDLDDLGMKTNDLTKEVMDIKKDLTGRIEDLETPPGSCSVDNDENCSPDGLMLAKDGIEAIIGRLCDMEFNCCDENERRYKFGLGIADVDDCKATFTDLVNRGFSPDFLESNGDIVRYVIDMAQALNDRDVKLAIDKPALDACLASLATRDCPKFAAEPDDQEPIDVCDLEFEPGEFPCDPRAFVKGLQKENEPCGLTFVPECDKEDDLVCRRTTALCVPGAGGCEGICAKSAKVDDRCTSDAECDSTITELFCDRRDNTCKERSDEGEDCAYINLYSTLSPGVDATYLQNPAAMAIECKRGLTCDPKKNVCVARCSEGSLCPAFGLPEGFGGVVPVGLLNACPDGNTCNVTENPGLRAFRYGVCRPALQLDEPCTHPQSGDPEYHECESDRCEFLDGYVCSPALKKAGESCVVGEAGVGQADATCESGFCAAASTTTTAGKCAERCNRQSDCADTHFCDTTTPLTTSIEGNFPCDLRRAENAPCVAISEVELSSNLGDNYRCATGYCDSTTDAANPVCKQKLAENSTCVYHPACPVGQYCNVGTCADTVGAGGACTSPNLPCDYGTDLVCATVEGEMNECVKVGAFPNGAYCATTFAVDGKPYSYDELCASGWCDGGTCADPIEEGEDCAVLTDRCVDGLFCEHELGETTGTCEPQHFVGEECNPLFAGRDCVGSDNIEEENPCELRADEYVCNYWAIEEETAFCDGE